MAFGVLKSRFRIIHASGGNLLYSLNKCVQIITACFVLHNIATINRVPVPTDDYVEPSSESDNQANESDDTSERQRGADVRQLMINYFSNN